MSTVRQTIFSSIALVMLLVGGKAGAQTSFNGDNAILQDTALHRFFKLLQHADTSVVSVLHLGDSHVQAGYFPQTNGGMMQQQFGNAGRGFVFPYNLAGTNGPEDYRWSSPVKWNSERVVDRYKSPVLGPGAIVINTNTNSPSLSFLGRQDSFIENSFIEADLFYDPGNDSSEIVSNGADIVVTPMPFTGSPTIQRAALSFQDLQQTFAVKFDNTAKGPFRFYGAYLRNGEHGVIYSSVGINGAMYQHYNDFSNILLAQMSVIKPQLVIISLGTNEAYGRFDALTFRNEIDKTVTLLREQNPNVCILLTTPPDCMRVTHSTYRKKVKGKWRKYSKTSVTPNPYIAMASAQIEGYAREHGLACWNFNAVNKVQRARFSQLWAPDHVHFSVKGYQLQGQLLNEAIQGAYRKYLAETKKTY
ncbi:GDSL-type esterase/lipase family protein [Chitinophaga sp. Hz27]|uniref:GDSL-type esterase/lipase family protein n=1 Tax=Chitinophaga sp. Hz27 TaxID=3347169 RepID=UPI0035DE8258